LSYVGYRPNSKPSTPFYVGGFALGGYAFAKSKKIPYLWVNLVEPYSKLKNAYGEKAFSHEIMHMLGLKHTFDIDTGCDWNDLVAGDKLFS
jgi:hypothetical protein